MYAIKALKLFKITVNNSKKETIWKDGQMESSRILIISCW